MNILVGITYYSPNVSGLTIYAKRLAEGLVKRGHKVTVLTSRFSNSLPKEEVINGVKVIRTPVLLKIGKGVVLPFLFIDILKVIKKYDLINCHLPQFESFIFAIVGKIFGKKVILTHHTDLSGWSGFFNRFSEVTLWCGQLFAGLFADKIIPYTKDYADYSWFLKLFKNKLEYVLPPILAGKVDKKLKKKLLEKIGKVEFIIGFSGRIARQKGIPYLLEAIPYLRKELTSFKVVFAGPYKTVIGENYYKKVESLIKKYKENLCFLGNINEEKMASFYSLCDVLVLPSDDRLESFGLVQAEAMLNGCPVVATNLPGVRVPIKLSGMGIIVEPKKPEEIAIAVCKILKEKDKFLRPKKEIEKIFSLEETIKKYEEIFK